MCTNPSKGFKFGKTAKGKDKYYIRPYTVNHLEYDARLDKIITCYDPTANLNNTPIREFIEIPCGKCLECKLQYSKNWANRCFLESKLHKDNCFLTLTYDDFNIPKSIGINLVTGEQQEYKTLVKRDFQLFIKRLRKKLEPLQIRYFGCGEYGETTKRPHYHIIIFGWKPNDLIPLGNTALKNCIYYSPIIQEIWPYGNNTVGDVTRNSASYVARYVTKKLNSYDDSIYDSMNIEQEFILMSKKPGIGAAWYDSHKECYANFIINYESTPDGSIAIPSNRYFDKLLDRENPEKLEAIKENRKEFAKHKQKIIQKSTTLPYLERLKVDDKSIKNRTKILQRKGV